LIRGLLFASPEANPRKGSHQDSLQLLRLPDSQTERQSCDSSAQQHLRHRSPKGDTGRPSQPNDGPKVFRISNSLDCPLQHLQLLDDRIRFPSLERKPQIRHDSPGSCGNSSSQYGDELLEFRRLLAEIAERYPRGREFCSSELAGSLGLPKKRVSNDLIRLYHRGFLKRHRRPRCMIIWSWAPRVIACNKGYEYVYVVNKQGENYVQWMISRRNSKSQERLDSIIRLYNEQARTEKLRERLRELDGQNCQDHVPTGRLQLIDYLADALLEERRRSEDLKREKDWLTKEASDAIKGERRAQDRANQYEAGFTAAIPVIVSLTDTIRAQREAARDPLSCKDIQSRAAETAVRLAGLRSNLTTNQAVTGRLEGRASSV